MSDEELGAVDSDALVDALVTEEVDEAEAEENEALERADPKEYTEGLAAYHDGQAMPHDCPYPLGADMERTNWIRGWRQGARTDEDADRKELRDGCMVYKAGMGPGEEG